MVEGSNPCQGITFPKVFAPPVNSNRHDYIVHGQCYYVIEVGMGYQTTRDNWPSGKANEITKMSNSQLSPLDCLCIALNIDHSM